MTNKSDCIFCQIVQGKSPCHEIWSSETHMAFLSIFPNTDGFTIVIPKEHHGSYAFEQSDKVISELIIATKKVANILDKYFNDVSRTGMFFEGFGVDHLHSKLFPMHGTGDLKNWSMIESKEKNTFYSKYPGYLCSNDASRANDEKLAKLAKAIKLANS